MHSEHPHRILDFLMHGFEINDKGPYAARCSVKHVLIINDIREQASPLIVKLLFLFLDYSIQVLMV